MGINVNIVDGKITEHFGMDVSEINIPMLVYSLNGSVYLITDIMRIEKNINSIITIVNEVYGICLYGRNANMPREEINIATILPWPGRLNVSNKTRMK